MTRILTLMGSGETSPTMVKAHRSVFERLANQGPFDSVFLETPFGFQENAEELSSKTLDYFDVSLNRRVEPAGLKRVDDLSTLDREAAFSRVRQAAFLFAGPGSPTFTLRQWSGTPVPDLLAEKLRNGGAVTFASAAALTLGVSTVPVYEIYKSGDEPHWLPGLDLLTAIGLPVAVIPHYNNAEGGHHDTRFCYLGERRLAAMERLLPEGAFVLGVDEHTGVVLDLDADTATVVGLGVVTIRRDGISTQFASGETVPIDALRNGPRDRPPTSQSTDEQVATSEAVIDVAASLSDVADQLGSRFDNAIDAGDAKSAVAAVLDLDSAVVEWSTDSLQSDATDRARSLLRSMIVRLGEAAESGLVDRRQVLAPVVDVALRARSEVRAAKRYDLSDMIRDDLGACGIEVRDAADGQVWELRSIDD